LADVRGAAHPQFLRSNRAFLVDLPLCYFKLRAGRLTGRIDTGIPRSARLAVM